MGRTISDALTKYWEVSQLPQFQPELFVQCALELKLVSEQKQAYEGLTALLQILCCLAENDHYEVPFILPKDEALQMYIALEQMYSGQKMTFQDFCYKHFGLCFHIHLLDTSGLTSEQVLEAGGAVYTLGQLQADFDDELSNLAAGWIDKLTQEKLKPGAIIWGRLQKSEMTPTQSSLLLKIINRWNQYIY